MQGGGREDACTKGASNMKNSCLGQIFASDVAPRGIIDRGKYDELRVELDKAVLPHVHGIIADNFK